MTTSKSSIAWRLICALLALSLCACAMQPKRPQPVPQVQPLKAKPLSKAARQQAPSQTYSSSVQADLSKWRQQLTEPSQPASSAKPSTPQTSN